MALFDEIVPKYMTKLMLDFDCTAEDAAAVFGNAGHESLGFEKLQEMKPTIKGSRGGWGWFQWTGPRRKDFEAYCKRNDLDPSSHETNYKFLFVELTGNESKTMPLVKRAPTLEKKVIAFEAAFERAGVKHYDRRLEWAERALRAYNVSISKGPKAPEPVVQTRGLLEVLVDFVTNLIRRFIR